MKRYARHLMLNYMRVVDTLGRDIEPYSAKIKFAETVCPMIIGYRKDAMRVVRKIKSTNRKIKYIFFVLAVFILSVLWFAAIGYFTQAILR